MLENDLWVVAVAEAKKEGRVEREMAERGVVDGRMAEELSVRRSKHATKANGRVETFIIIGFRRIDCWCRLGPSSASVAVVVELEPQMIYSIRFRGGFVRQKGVHRYRAFT